MDAFRKHATKLREQVAKQQQAVARQFSSHSFSGSDTIVTDAAELQRHQQLEKLHSSTRAGKHYQRDIVKGLEGVISTGTRQIEVVDKFCEEFSKYASESFGGQGLLGISLLAYGKHRVRLEREREVLFNNVTCQVVEPLKTMINGSPLQEARHLAQRYDRMRQDAEAQKLEVGKRQARLKETGPSAESTMKLQIAEARLQELMSSMALLGKEAAAALCAVETQQQRLSLHRLISLVENERSYHKRAEEILDQIQAQIISERQKIDSQPPTEQKIPSIIDSTSTLPTMEDTKPMSEEMELSNTLGRMKLSKNSQNSSFYLAEVVRAYQPLRISMIEMFWPSVVYYEFQVMHGFDAEAEGELSLSVGEFVVVRQVSQTGWSEGECKGCAGWFPTAYVEYRHQVPASKLMETFA